MTKQEFDLKYRGKKVAIHCDTEEKAKAFLKFLKSIGYKWLSGKDLESKTMWDIHKDKTVYFLINAHKDFVVFGTIDGYAKENDCKIIPFELDEPNGYAIEDTPSPMKETFKVGDAVYAKKNGVELKVTETDLYRLETKDGTAWFMKKELLTKTKPKRLQKITKKELADMGYVLKK